MEMNVLDTKCEKHPRYVTVPFCPECRCEAEQARATPEVPVHFIDATFIGMAPAGAQIIAVGLKVLMVSPDGPPCWVTPTGLVPIDVAPAKT